MATEHDKMNSDYIWIRDHSADSGPQSRVHGYNYLYYHVPNYQERIEMTWRSLGRQYDWELEKFRCSKKTIDRGNKKRIFKNFFRFAKNPLGYIFWRTYRFREHRGRFQQAGLFFLAVGLLYNGKDQSNRNMRICNTRVHLGENLEGSGSDSFGWNKGRYAHMKVPLFGMFQNDVPADLITISPAKDQVFRKYFEMRKRKGIKEGEFF